MHFNHIACLVAYATQRHVAGADCVAAGRLVRRTTGHRTAAQRKLDRRRDDEMTDNRITLVKVFGENIHAG